MAETMAKGRAWKRKSSQSSSRKSSTNRHWKLSKITSPSGQTTSIKVFLQVWDYLQALSHAKALYAIRWLLRHEPRLRMFLVSIEGLDLPNISKGFLYNGYLNCAHHSPKSISEEAWANAHELFHNFSLHPLPQPLRAAMLLLGKPDLQELLGKFEQERAVAILSGCFSRTKVPLVRIGDQVVLESLECFLGDWDNTSVFQRFPADVHHHFKRVPKEYVMARQTHNYMEFYDMSDSQPQLVALHINRASDISVQARQLVRELTIDLFNSHNDIVRKSSAAFESAMVGHGPRFSRYNKGKDLVAFYTSTLKMENLLKNWSSAQDFQELIDQHAHTDLFEIVLGIWLWWYPSMLSAFLACSQPYLTYPQCSSLAIAEELGEKGPPAYQMYITENYCSEMHSDHDATEFTLCLASHPDAASYPDAAKDPIEFVIGNVGLRLPIGDFHAWAFRSELPHATVYRAPTQNAAYAVCVAINNPLRQVMQRRMMTAPHSRR